MTTTTPNKKAVDVAITSDLMCPWCWVGLRKLQEASKIADVDTRITWKPYLLRPNLPEEGIPKADPTPESRVSKHLKVAGREVGIDFTGLTDRTPNTTLFHAVMKMLQDDRNFSSELVTRFHEAVFEGYFTLGVFPDDDGILTAAEKVADPILVESIQDLLDDAPRLSKLQKEVREEARDASMRGISGVPAFEFNGVPAFSGAQPVSTFVGYLKNRNS